MTALTTTLTELIVRDFQAGKTMADIAEARDLAHVKVEQAIRRWMLLQQAGLK